MPNINNKQNYDYSLLAAKSVNSFFACTCSGLCRYKRKTNTTVVKCNARNDKSAIYSKKFTILPYTYHTLH